MLARRFYDVAEKLANDGRSGPPEYRTAISRAYYAAFHHAIDFLIAVDVQPPGGQGAHGGIPHALQASADSEVQLAGSGLAGLYTNRRKADYLLKNIDPEQRDTVLDSVGDCARILIKLDDCLSDSARTATVRTALRAWAVSAVGQSLNFRVI